MLAVIVNSLAIIAGGILGIVFKKGIPERVNKMIVYALGLVVMYIGITGMLSGENTLITIFSMAAGTVIGSLIKLHDRFNEAVEGIFNRMKKGKTGADSRFIDGFMTATLLFCIGSMAVMGSLQAGIAHDYMTLFTKSIIDGITAIAFASVYGAGVLLSAIPILIYEGAITLLAQFVSPLMTDLAVAEMTCTGSLLLIAIAFNMLDLVKDKVKIKVMDMLPSVFMPLIICPLLELTGIL